LLICEEWIGESKNGSKENSWEAIALAQVTNEDVFDSGG